MTRKEMLEWIYTNCQTIATAKHHREVKDAIGEQYYKELNQMQFVNRTYKVGEAYIYMSWLGITYYNELIAN